MFATLCNMSFSEKEHSVSNKPVYLNVNAIESPSVGIFFLLLFQVKHSTLVGTLKG